MSKYFSVKFVDVRPYTPGEQPKHRQWIKLNTNESPFPPSPGVHTAVASECSRLQLYSDPECSYLREKLAEVYGVNPGQIIVTNGSDEVLNFAFMAFADETHPLVFPDITYGFYPVFARLNRIPYMQIPLKEDFTVDPEDYRNIGKTVVLANPNAPTGLALSAEQIEDIVSSNPDTVVIIDEAYVDFGGDSVVPLVHKYDNLLVTRTFSKSRSMAGARLGFGIGNEALIADLNRIRYSTNPYNVNRMTEAAGLAALTENTYYMENCRIIQENRLRTTDALRTRGFRVLDSRTNFLFADSGKPDARGLYLKLKEKGILVRYFDQNRIRNFIRISIGTKEQMEAFIRAIDDIRKEEGYENG